MTKSVLETPGGIIKKTTGLIAGTTKNIVGKMTVIVAGVMMTAGQIVARLQAIVAAYQSVQDARTAYVKALAAWKAQLPAAKLFVGDYTAAIKGQLGRRSAELADFGIAVLKAPKPRSAAEKTIAAEAAQRTKQARGTGLGKRQRAAITTDGKPGLQLLDPSGKPVESTLPAPVAPGQVGSAATPATAAPASDGAPAGAQEASPAK